MSLALSTLIFEWRRYMAAVVALALSGMLVLVMLGLFTGIIHAELATTERSRSDIFILPAKVASMVNNNATLPARVEPQIFLNPHVTEVRSLDDAGGSWTNTPAAGQKQVQTYVDVWSVDPIPGAVTLPIDYTEADRIALVEPGAVAVDASALAKLGVKLGDKASINGHTVWVRAILHDYATMEQPNLTASRETVRQLHRVQQTNTDTGPLMVRIDSPANADLVVAQINAGAHGAYKAWTRKDFLRANENAVLGEQIIGVLLVFLTFMASLIGVGITSQTLRGAILSNIREFASLRALGISMGSLRWIVMELAFWVGVAGVIAALAVTAATAAAAGASGLPIIIRPIPAALLCGLLTLIAIASGAMAMGVLKKGQPADLLR
ncbi:MAG TPA: ABC transporter permease [Caulobacteraceae bacterium]|jgi:putative ABC transport system permease protein|nr:ABC transporter permease [Caulobacteraceae bacterium]